MGEVGRQGVTDCFHFGDEVGDNGVQLWLQTSLKGRDIGMM